MSAPQLKSQAPEHHSSWLDLVRQQVSSLQFGTVEIVVHDARVVQIEKTERVRLTQRDAGEGARVVAPAAIPGPSAAVAHPND